MKQTAKQAALEREVRETCEKRGLRILPFGRAWRIVGPGVDLLVAKLSYAEGWSLRPTFDD